MLRWAVCGGSDFLRAAGASGLEECECVFLVFEPVCSLCLVGIAGPGNRVAFALIERPVLHIQLKSLQLMEA